MPELITVDVRLLSDAKPVAGLANVTIETALGELTIRKVKIIHQDDKQPWIALPNNDYKEQGSGEWKHVPILDLGVRLKKAVFEAVLIKYSELSVASR